MFLHECMRIHSANIVSIETCSITSVCNLTPKVNKLFGVFFCDFLESGLLLLGFGITPDIEAEHFAIWVFFNLSTPLKMKSKIAN